MIKRGGKTKAIAFPFDVCSWHFYATPTKSWWIRTIANDKKYFGNFYFSICWKRHANHKVDGFRHIQLKVLSFIVLVTTENMHDCWRSQQSAVNGNGKSIIYQFRLSFITGKKSTESYPKSLYNSLVIYFMYPVKWNPLKLSTFTLTLKRDEKSTNRVVVRSSQKAFPTHVASY